MYKAVAQLVLLYENKSWVVDMEVLKVLTVFQNQVEWRISGMAAKRGADREGGYPAVEEVIDSVGIHPIRV